jgi:hypothetical protein
MRRRLGWVRRVRGRPGPLRYNSGKSLPRRGVEMPVRQAFGASCYPKTCPKP